MFVCVDSVAARAFIIPALEARDLPYSDCGLGLCLVDDRLMGLVRVTTSTRRCAVMSMTRSHTDGGDPDDDLYRSNIQMADLNMLAGALAVIQYKQLRGVYLDTEAEYHALRLDAQLVRLEIGEQLGLAARAQCLDPVDKPERDPPGVERDDPDRRLGLDTLGDGAFVEQDVIVDVDVPDAGVPLHVGEQHLAELLDPTAVNRPSRNSQRSVASDTDDLLRDIDQRSVKSGSPSSFDSSSPAPRGKEGGNRAFKPLKAFGDPYGNRTRVSAVKGPRPGPLDEGAVKARPPIGERRA